MSDQICTNELVCFGHIRQGTRFRRASPDGTVRKGIYTKNSETDAWVSAWDEGTRLFEESGIVKIPPDDKVQTVEPLSSDRWFSVAVGGTPVGHLSKELRHAKDWVEKNNPQWDCVIWVRRKDGFPEIAAVYFGSRQNGGWLDMNELNFS